MELLTRLHPFLFSRGMNQPVRIAMWSGPRNISTAMMRAWENRPDAIVVDEPFYANYLLHSGVAHPAREEVMGSQSTDEATVIESILEPLPDGINVLYQKHMAHHMRNGMDRTWLSRVTNCFLIRDPCEMLISLDKVFNNPRLEDTGLPQQVDLFTTVQQQTGEIPPVLDARDVLLDPPGALTALCDTVGVAFSDRMVSWPAGPRDSDGVWGKHWYGSVWQSTGFQPYRPRKETLSEALLPCLAECERLYHHLYDHRLRW